MGCLSVSFCNMKGGVGKTSTCHHLAGTLARIGHRVLLVDMDPQASLTQGFWGPDATRAIGRDESVAALFDDDLAPIPDALIRPTGFERLWIVPGSRHLTRHNVPEPELAPRDRQVALREFLAEVRDDFDLILVDNPPNLHLCSRVALIASDFIVAPLQAEDYGAQGLEPVHEAIASVQAGPNPSLRLAGYLLSMFDKRLGIHLAYESLLRDLYGPDVFSAPFPAAKDFKEAVAARQPISHYKPKSAAAKAARTVADELLVRIGAVPQDVRRVA